MSQGDTGLEWAGWQRSASEALMHSTRDSRPDCVIERAREAISAGREALKVAKNPRQLDVTDSLLEAAYRVKRRAQDTPEDM